MMRLDYLLTGNSLVTAVFFILSNRSFVTIDPNGWFSQGVK